MKSIQIFFAVFFLLLTTSAFSADKASPIYSEREILLSLKWKEIWEGIHEGRSWREIVNLMDGVDDMGLLTAMKLDMLFNKLGEEEEAYRYAERIIKIKDPTQNFAAIFAFFLRDRDLAALEFETPQPYRIDAPTSYDKKWLRKILNSLVEYGDQKGEAGWHKGYIYFVAGKASLALGTADEARRFFELAMDHRNSTDSNDRIAVRSAQLLAGLKIKPSSCRSLSE